MRWWIVYWVAVIAIAISALLFIDFMFTGISMLVLLLVIANIRFLWERSDRISWQKSATAKQPVVELPIKAEHLVLAMAYIHFKDGTTKTVMNLQTDYKVGEDMKFYEKNKRHNRWDEMPNVDSVEFYLHEMDEIIPKQR